jgi:hypothetical protein
MTSSQEYLEAYDRQLRTDAETPSAIAVQRLGPLRLVTFAGGRGFVTYQDLGGAGDDRRVGQGGPGALPCGCGDHAGGVEDAGA